MFYVIKILSEFRILNKQTNADIAHIIPITLGPRLERL